jgi:hypothetical protein
MQTKESRRQVRHRAAPALSTAKFHLLQMNPWGVFLFPAVLSLFIACGIVLTAERRTVAEVDRKFLDDVVRQQSRERQIISALGQNVGTVGEIPLNHPAVLRGELVVNSAIVKRGELVVHGGLVRHSRSSITTSRQNSQVAAERGKSLN